VRRIAVNEQLQRLLAIVDRLRIQEPTTVRSVICAPLYSQWGHHGIYEIRETDDNETVYIGKTIRAREGVAQRIWDHAKQISSLVNDLGITRDRFGEYQVRSIEIQDARFRGLAEYFAIALLDPKGNRVG
jgi:hypothetical protein